MSTHLHHLGYILALLLCLCLHHPALTQAEVTAWGNIGGIRIEGQLMEFETSIAVVTRDWHWTRRTAKERQQSRFARDGQKRIVDLRLDSLFFTKTVEDIGPGSAKVDIAFTSRVDTALTGVFFRLDLPTGIYTDAAIKLDHPRAPVLRPASVSGPDEILRIMAEGIRLEAPGRQLALTFAEPTEVIVKADSSSRTTDYQILFRLFSGAIAKGDSIHKSFTLTAAGDIDREPIELTVDATQVGRPFAGLGGNFRIQNTRVDPAVIDYCLENLRVAWGRVEMPWQHWHPVDSLSPIAEAKAGRLHPRVKAAMEMAQRLDKMGMPVILSAWWGPEWALVGERARGGVNPDGTRGNPLRPDRMADIYTSIADYVQYLRDEYGVEVVMFSFNESDLGIDIRQTAREHAELIKGLGAYFAQRGLKTKLLLGDTADANGYAFMDVAMDDPATHPYIGAVSFHSWRGCDDATLRIWAAATERLQKPLIIGEGSIDAGAWRYPSIFTEAIYAREEIELYTRILNICQPATILQWQLTADYSPLVGGGIFGNDAEELRPTQRFWNLKQLSATPENVHALAITSNKDNVTCAALGNPDKGKYAIHLVNQGPTREVTISGLPDKLRRLRLYITDEERGMQEGDRLRVRDGRVSFTLPALSFTSLLAD